MGDHPVARPLSTHRATQTQNKPAIPVFERAKRVDVLDRAATAIGKGEYS
jgi:hypothetical protein